MTEKNDQPSDIDLNDDGQPAATTSEAAAPAPAEAPPPTPEERISLLENEKAELRDRMLRIAADFDNWKKRSRKEKEDGEARVREGVVRDFLEIIDNLERATASFAEGKEADAKSIREGVDLVLRQFRTKLERLQVKPIEAIGQPFDPRFHEAISQVPSPDAKPGSVVHELQKGYVIGDKLLRAAMVVVAAAAPAPSNDKPPGDGVSTGAHGEGED